MSTSKTLARVAGLLYLMMAVATGIGGYARGSLVVSGDPSTTAANLRASAFLFRSGVVADLVSATLFLLTAMALYVLLRNVNRLAAGAMVIFVVVSVAIQALNLVNEMVALSLAAASTSGLGQAGSDGLTLVFLQVQHDGFVISQMFFALWLLPLGYLVVSSEAFPRVLGYLLAIACVGYLVDLLAYFLAPGLEGSVLPFSAVAGAVGELAFAVWLVVIGARFPGRGAGVAATPRAELATAARR